VPVIGNDIKALDIFAKSFVASQGFVLGCLRGIVRQNTSVNDMMYGKEIKVSECGIDRYAGCLLSATNIRWGGATLRNL
jgi:hypothetical protein